MESINGQQSGWSDKDLLLKTLALAINLANEQAQQSVIVGAANAGGRARRLTSKGQAGRDRAEAGQGEASPRCRALPPAAAPGAEAAQGILGGHVICLSTGGKHHIGSGAAAAAGRGVAPG